MTLCPRCNQWRTSGQMGPAVCGACECTGPECHRAIFHPKLDLCGAHARQRLRGQPLTPIRPVMPVSLLIDEVRTLAGSDTVEGVARRLGMKPGSIHRQLLRAGRIDLWYRLRGAA